MWVNEAAFFYVPMFMGSSGDYNICYEGGQANEYFCIYYGIVYGIIRWLTKIEFVHFFNKPNHEKRYFCMS